MGFNPAALRSLTALLYEVFDIPAANERALRDSSRFLSIVRRPPVAPAAPVAPSKPTTAVKVEYQTPTEVLQAAGVAERGKAIIASVGEVGRKYLDLCQYIRDHSIAPKLVSNELGKLGFKRSRIAELNKVAGASDELWDAFQARRIGFKDTLELARKAAEGVGMVATEAAKLLVDKGAIGQEDVDAEASAPPSGKGRTNTASQTAKAKVVWLLKQYANPKDNPKGEAKVFTGFKDFPGWSVRISKTH